MFSPSVLLICLCRTVMCTFPSHPLSSEPPVAVRMCKVLCFLSSSHFLPTFYFATAAFVGWSPLNQSTVRVPLHCVTCVPLRNCLRADTALRAHLSIGHENARKLLVLLRTVNLTSSHLSSCHSFMCGANPVCSLTAASRGP